MVDQRKTVNSLSGGKTSSYIAVHYPADYELFALVCNEDINCRPKDNFLIKYATDKLNKYCWQYEDLIGTAEDEGIIKTMYDLEQMIGREIIWVRGESFDSMCRRKKAIPNKSKRFCTTELKIKPIFDFCFTQIGEVVDMRIGYRYDELERVKKFKPNFKYSKMMKLPDGKMIKMGDSKWRNRWEEIKWRVGSFPLVEEKLLHYHIKMFWQNKGIKFADDSNCKMCLWKQWQQIQRNITDAPNVMNWASRLEKEIGYSFNDVGSIEKISKFPVQTSLFSYGTGAGCMAGGCTD